RDTRTGSKTLGAPQAFEIDPEGNPVSTERRPAAFGRRTVLERVPAFCSLPLSGPSFKRSMIASSSYSRESAQHPRVTAVPLCRCQRSLYICIVTTLN